MVVTVGAVGAGWITNNRGMFYTDMGRVHLKIDIDFHLNDMYQKIKKHISYAYRENLAIPIL